MKEFSFASRSVFLKLLFVFSILKYLLRDVELKILPCVVWNCVMLYILTVDKIPKKMKPLWLLQYSLSNNIRKKVDFKSLKGKSAGVKICSAYKVMCERFPYPGRILQVCTIWLSQTSYNTLFCNHEYWYQDFYMAFDDGPSILGEKYSKIVYWVETNLCN